LEGLTSTIDKINAHSIAERIDLFSMREDRADVIPFASEIYLKVMGWSCATEILVPDVGLKDGIIEMLYERIK